MYDDENDPFHDNDGDEFMDTSFMDVPEDQWKDRSDLTVANMLSAVFHGAFKVLAEDLNRAVTLLREGRLAEEYWLEFCEGQFDLLMARGYDRLSDEQKAEFLPLGYCQYADNAQKGDMCFIPPSYSRPSLRIMGETKFIRKGLKKGAAWYEEQLSGDALKPCHYMAWIFEGSFEQFLPADSSVACGCRKAQEWKGEYACPEALAVTDAEGRRRVFYGSFVKLLVPEGAPDMPPEYEGFLWVLDGGRGGIEKKP